MESGQTYTNKRSNIRKIHFPADKPACFACGADVHEHKRHTKLSVHLRRLRRKMAGNPQTLNYPSFNYLKRKLQKKKKKSLLSHDLLERSSVNLQMGNNRAFNYQLGGGGAL